LIASGRLPNNPAMHKSIARGTALAAFGLLALEPALGAECVVPAE
jgi:hypothetical protein